MPYSSEMNNTDSKLTAREAAVTGDCDDRTVWRAIRSEKLTSRLIGRCRLIDLVDLDRRISACQLPAYPMVPVSVAAAMLLAIAQRHERAW